MVGQYFLYRPKEKIHPPVTLEFLAKNRGFKDVKNTQIHPG